MAASSASFKLRKSLLYLTSHSKLGQEHTACNHCSHHRSEEDFLDSDTWSQIGTLRRVLSKRYPVPEIPQEIQEDLDTVVAYRNSHTPLTSTTSISPIRTLQHPVIKNATKVRLACWKGDITTLTDVTAIVNAANSGLLGCFVPGHRCIDNAIHSAAGPRLRDACHQIMSSQDGPEPVGLAKVTPGFQLPASWVLHTVGPQLSPRQSLQSHHETQLASCYHSCLNAAESLPPLPDGRKIVAFCCISTGLFAFPSDKAARVAVNAVREWFLAHPMTSLTDVIFNTFLDNDHKIYLGLLQNSPQNNQSGEEKGSKPDSISKFSACPLPTPTPRALKARAWIENADVLVISAGAGLSAAAGLDYTSQDLFKTHFPAFRAKGLRRLYDVFGYNGWNSLAEKWGYYFLHLAMVRNWAHSPIYKKLLGLAERFPGKHFVRTSNADGFFVKNGFDEGAIATPQGQYRFLQCFRKCKHDAYVLSDPYVDAALPFIDPVSQLLMDESKVPRCQFCHGEMTLCVRGGNYFNAKPFQNQELAWKRFLHELEHGLDSDDDEEGTSPSRSPKKVVILELGVGLNTPGVLRWPNEDLVSESDNQAFRLIRVGMEASGCAPWELEERGLAVGISVNIPAALDLIVP